MFRLTAGVLLLLTYLLVLPREAMSQVWTVAGFDPKGDARMRELPDAAQLSYRYDRKEDMLWFRLSLYGKPDTQGFGVNIAVDTGGSEAEKMNWWGANKNFKFDKLITASVTRGDTGYHGTIGIGNTVGVRANNLTNLSRDNLKIEVEGDSIILGLKRSDLTDKMKMTLIGAVGSNQSWNDDIPNAMPISVDLLSARPVRGLLEIDTGRNNFRLPADYRTLPDNKLPLVSKRGHGPTPLVLIPGVYSGNQPFDSFIERNSSKYRALVLTPPGIAGTAARPLPLEDVSYGDFTWTNRLASDLVKLIRVEKLQKPIIITHGFPASLAAEEVATRYPELLSGIIEVASIPVQFFPSSKDPTRRTSATPEERIETVNEGWAKKWFKFVTPETWESNNYPASMFLNDPIQAEARRREVEAVPLEVKIRYLCEFMASDHSKELSNMPVPLLALVPAFNKDVLADPVNSFYKPFFQDSWQPFSKTPNIRIVTIPDTRVLILDDQPKFADEAIAQFITEVQSSRNASQK